MEHFVCCLGASGGPWNRHQHIQQCHQDQGKISVPLSSSLVLFFSQYLYTFIYFVLVMFLYSSQFPVIRVFILFCLFVVFVYLLLALSVHFVCVVWSCAFVRMCVCVYCVSACVRVCVRFTLCVLQVPLRTNHPGLLTWYNCGPTVYDSAHIGHALWVHTNTSTQAEKCIYLFIFFGSILLNFVTALHPSLPLKIWYVLLFDLPKMLCHMLFLTLVHSSVK